MKTSNNPHHFSKQQGSQPNKRQKVWILVDYFGSTKEMMHKGLKIEVQAWAKMHNSHQGSQGDNPELLKELTEAKYPASLKRSINGLID